MRKLLIAFCLAAVPAVGAAQAPESPTAVVEALFAAMKAGDADAMAALLHPEVRLVSTSVRDGAPTVQVVSAERWLQSVGSSTRELDERIYDVVAHEEAGLASVWMRYDLYVDGTHSHCGVDAIQLVRTADGWRIIEIADTRSTEGCRGS